MTSFALVHTDRPSERGRPGSNRLPNTSLHHTSPAVAVLSDVVKARRLTILACKPTVSFDGPEAGRRSRQESEFYYHVSGLTAPIISYWSAREHGTLIRILMLSYFCCLNRTCVRHARRTGDMPSAMIHYYYQAKISANAASVAWSIGGGAGGASPGGKNSSSATLAVRIVLPPNCLTSR